MLHSIFGEEILTAVLSGIAPSTRSKYGSRGKRWDGFTKERGLEHWIVRTSPDWDGVQIDFILFETRTMGSQLLFPNGRYQESASGICWPDSPDFTIGCGRYVQVRKSARRPRTVNRKVPATIEMLDRLGSIQTESARSLSLGVF